MNTLRILMLYILASAAQTALAQFSDKRPNVIVVLTDDQGYGDFSCHGNPVLRTPALDKLHGESVRFSNFHVAPLCTPTRGQLMTGLDAFHNKASTVGAGRDILRRDLQTMPEIFARNGYQTGIFGKWHLGDNYPDRPMDRGFQKAVWIKGWGLLSEAEFDNDYYKTRYLDGTELKYSDRYCTDLWFSEAKTWMSEMADAGKPFFTYLATNTPHGPVYSPASNFNYYKEQGLDDKTAHFLGMIENIDSNMAELDKWLEYKHLKENTLIVFMNDNGGTGGVELFNAGMRGQKGENYDGGHRAACFIRWPAGSLKAPATVALAAQVQDILPTFVDLLKLNVSGVQSFDGISLRPALTSGVPPAADRMFVVQYSGNNGPTKYFSCVVWNSWRLVGKSELYNLETDPGQAFNMASTRPDLLKKMSAHYEQWWNKSEPVLRPFLPLVVGSARENPVILTSGYWKDSAYVNTQWKVAQAGGPVNGGKMLIYAEKAGRYKVELSRWPFELKRSLSAIGPDLSIGGTALRKGRAVPVALGALSLDEAEPIVIEKDSANAASISLELQLSAGEHAIGGWFRDKNGNDICGAYYLRLTLLEPS